MTYFEKFAYSLFISIVVQVLFFYKEFQHIMLLIIGISLFFVIIAICAHTRIYIFNNRLKKIFVLKKEPLVNAYIKTKTISLFDITSAETVTLNFNSRKSTYQTVLKQANGDPVRVFSSSTSSKNLWNHRTELINNFLKNKEDKLIINETNKFTSIFAILLAFLGGTIYYNTVAMSNNQNMYWLLITVTVIAFVIINMLKPTKYDNIA